MRLLHEEEKREVVIQLTQAEEVTSDSAEIARLQQTIERRRSHCRSANRISLSALAGELLTIPVLQHFIQSSSDIGIPLVVWAGSSISIGALSLLYTWRGKKALERAVMDLAEHASSEAIGPLIDMVEFYGPYNAFGTLGSDYGTYQTAVQALTRRLPQVSAEERSRISAHHSRQLSRVLPYVANPLHKRRYNVPFAIAILNALEQIGDTSAVPFVERLAQMKPQNEDRRLLQAAADACLARLRDRAREVELQSSLLRASDASVSDTLLRATVESSTTDPTELLRAGHKDDR